ncbi:MAG: TetR/AcrR family transcriptional regulator [Lachnospiraceae bacterium]|nr:TetR/AcrR family transcriptional regulator [Lachnospiraceae bacterium]
MNTAQNQRHMETERKLREALLYYMNMDREPTVGQICERAEINRSTFYRHYVDVYDLMVHVEQDFQHGLYQTLHNEYSILTRLGKDPHALAPLIAYIGKNPHFYRVYLKNGTHSPWMEEFQRQNWEDRIKPLFMANGVLEEIHMRYYYEFIKSGFITILSLWLENGCQQSPEEMSFILYELLPIHHSSNNLC